MRLIGRSLILTGTVSLLFLFLFSGKTHAQAPVISGTMPTSGTVGTLVEIDGSSFGATQGTSTVSLSGTSATVMAWSDTAVVVVVPSGALSGPFSVTVNSQTAYSPSFTVTPLPTGWYDADVGSVGVAGSATYANGTFTVKGTGLSIDYGAADGMNLAYQPMSGDGTIVARMVSLQGSYAQVGVMIRETLNANSANAYSAYNAGYYIYFSDRLSSGANGSYTTDYVSVTLPYWVKVVRSGSTFSGYKSTDGVNWVQVGSNQTITMAQNVYVGLALSSNVNSTLATATFDNVSVNSAANPAPVISTLSATTGAVGSQVVISGSAFRASQGSSLVTLSGASVTVNSWSDTSITITIPSGATSGPLVVSVAPSMNDSNAVVFAVTSQPLPTSWLDQDVGPVGALGSATYANGTFTVKGAGLGIDAGTTDKMHFAYRSMSGDGTIVARMASLQGSYAQVGVMIRETLNANSTNAYTSPLGSPYLYFFDRLSSGANGSYASNYASMAVPYWVKVVRSGSTFSGYESPDGVNWVQVGSNQSITMAQNVYVGLAVSSNVNSTLATATFDNVSISSIATPAPVINTLSATTGPVGSQVLISGFGFGASQGSSVVLLNGTPVTVNSWSDTAITITIPSGATSGLLAISVAPSMNDSNAVVFAVTSQPLPTSWLDQDVGPVGARGSATYSNGTFTVQGAGSTLDASATDVMHFAYQLASGNGTVIARVVSVQGSYAWAGVMVRETLNANATNAFSGLAANSPTYLPKFADRPSPGASGFSQNGFNVALPYWVKLVRSGNTFTGYQSANGTTWWQIGSSQTITMAQNVYVGLAVNSGTTSPLATATFDNFSSTFSPPTPSPVVWNLSPSSGALGTLVTISGTNFGATQGASTITFNGSSASSITSWNNTQIIATVPATSTSGPVVVVVNSIPSNANTVFTVIHPVLNAVTPPSAPVGGAVTLSGSGFGASQGSNQVQFSGTNGVMGGVTSWSDTSITVNVPYGATNGPVMVVESGVASNGVQFTVTEPLSITAISPTVGPVGSAVTITGTGFSATRSSSTVGFYGATATSISSWSDTQIVVVVPSGASTGPVSVTVAGITASGPTFAVNSTVQLTDALGHQSSYTSVITGGKWYVSQAQGSGCSSCTLRGNVTYAYDNRGNISSVTDELGHIISYTYDSSNNVTSTLQPAVGGTSPTTTYAYNSFGEVLTMTDPLGHVTTNAYDSHGNLTSVTSPAPDGNTAASVTHFAYNSLGELTQITDPLGHVTTITYTSAGLIATITDPQSHVTTYAYDSRGNRTSITDALLHVTSFAYDSGNRLTTITYPDSATTTFTYDYRGRRTTATDQNSKTTTYAYDDADRLTSVTDAALHVTTYAYDTENNLLTITDANTHATMFAYDAFGRVTQTTFPSNLFETYAYDADNNLTSKTDRKNQTINYVYDALNRLTQKSYPDSTSIQYTYDLIGKVMQVNDPTGTYGFSYDNMGRLAGTTAQYSFLSGTTFTNAYTYDAASNRTGFTAPDNSTNTYSYDTLNRLSTLANSWAGSFGFSYDALSRRTQMTRPNNVTTNYSYDNLSHLLSVLHQLSGGTIDGAVYTVDSAGNRTAKTDDYASVTSNYTYDSLYELTQMTQGSTTTESYSYDAVGNRTASLGVSSYTTNSSNELTATSNASYAYDYNGNTTSKADSGGTTSYTWDYENRLASVTLPGSGGTVTFKYDPFGRRIYKSSSAGTSIFAYDGDNLVEETNSSGAVVARYTQTQNIDEPLAMLRSSTTSYYQADGIGSITSLTNGAGALAQTYTFDSFGKQTASSGSLVNPFRYTARESDTETGLYYYRARYYDASTGRFISEDPSVFEGGTDFYPYVDNNATDYFDPFGLQKRKPRNKPAPPVDPCPKDKRRFFCWLDDPLGHAAQDLGTTKALMLTMAAKEGGWTEPDLNHNMPLNNPFGVNKIKNGQAVGNINYPSLPAAISAWEQNFGDRVSGTQSPDDFAYGLEHPDPPRKPYNSAHKDTYEGDFQDVYDAVVRFMKLCGINP